MKLKVLLVDDELPILNNLAKVIPWEALHFEVIGLAREGNQALEAALLHGPDLILSDIRMPVMDGLTLIRKVREHGLDSEILLLTGYQEFEYARTGIKYGVRDYICKPIDYYALEETVRRLAGQIADKRNRQFRQRHLNRMAHWLSEKYLLYSLLGQVTEEDQGWWDEEEERETERTEGSAGLNGEAIQNPKPNHYSLLLLEAEGYAGRSLSWSFTERKSWNLQIKQQLKDLFQPLLREHIITQLREGEWCLLYPADTEEDLSKERFRPFYERLQAWVRGEKGGMAIRMCLEAGCLARSDLHSAYQRLQRLLLSGPAEEWFLRADDLPSQEAGLPVEEEDADRWVYIEELGSALRHGPPDALNRIADGLTQYAERMAGTQRTGEAERMLNYVLIHLMRELRELRVLTGEDEAVVWGRLQESLGLKDLLALAKSLLNRALTCHVGRKSAEMLMHSAQSYIRDHLANDFGIEEIADFLGISCSYFCLLFKNHFGETFVEYLTRQRMEMAKDLLSGSDKTIAQICSAVGYQERRYFSKVFQKYTGMTPSDFRIQQSRVT
ncbi:helix-turn-helix domain-containing protein [Paenibacillus sanfengchensis]|uniref:helix-turn-helix domain-containing protein n=1 Tax=Paenibacillus sanfengchensis TaxID=3119819 RepID=UPI002FE233DA